MILVAVFIANVFFTIYFLRGRKTVTRSPIADLVLLLAFGTIVWILLLGLELFIGYRKYPPPSSHLPRRNWQPPSPEERERRLRIAEIRSKRQ